MRNLIDRMAMGRGKTVSCALVAVFAFAVLSVSAEGTGPFGYPNLLANPDFENSTIASDSNNGKWGWFSGGKVSVNGWTGYGNAGIASATDTIWQPRFSDNDNYRVFIQMQNGWTDDASYIEQTVTVATSMATGSFRGQLRRRASASSCWASILASCVGMAKVSCTPNA